LLFLGFPFFLPPTVAMLPHPARLQFLAAALQANRKTAAFVAVLAEDRGSVKGATTKCRDMGRGERRRPGAALR